MKPVLTNITLNHEACDIIGKPTQAVYRNWSHSDFAGNTQMFRFTDWRNLKENSTSGSGFLQIHNYSSPLTILFKFSGNSGISPQLMNREVRDKFRIHTWSTVFITSWHLWKTANEYMLVYIYAYSLHITTQELISFQHFSCYSDIWKLVLANHSGNTAADPWDALMCHVEDFASMVLWTLNHTTRKVNSVHRERQLQTTISCLYFTCMKQGVVI